MDSLDLKHAKSVLLFIFDNGTLMKSNLFHIVKSHQVLDNLLESLENDGYLIINKNEKGPKKYTITLTPKGKSVAQKLKEAEEIASGKPVPNPLLTRDHMVLIYLLYNGEILISKLKEKFPDAYSSVDLLKQFSLVETKIDKEKFPQETIVYLSEKGKKVASCLREIKEILGGG